MLKENRENVSFKRLVNYLVHYILAVVDFKTTGSDLAAWSLVKT